MPTSFDTQMMDAILDNAEDQVQEIAKNIEEDKALIAVNENVEVERVYNELENLISLGNGILKNAKYAVEMDPTAEGVLAGTASMMNAVKDTVKEFTKIHLQNLKFEQQVQLEKLKQLGREKIIELRKSDDDEEFENLVPFNQESIIKEIMENKK
jgi:orotidine-5'-phosphate decarboxylase